MTLPAFLAATLARWGAMMQRPLREPVPVDPLRMPLLCAPLRDWTAFTEARIRERERCAAAVAAAEPALLPSTDYRTNPRPVQVPIEDPALTLDALRAGLLARGPRADALRAAVVRAAVRDI